MLTPIQILALVDSLHEKADISDTFAALRFSAEFPDSTAFSSWKDFREDPGPNIVRVAITVAGSDVDIGSEAEFVAGRRYRFNLAKPFVEGEPRLFYISAATGEVMAAAAGQRLRIAELSDDQAFKSRRLSVETWHTHVPVGALAPEGEAIDPTARVFDLSDPRIVPQDLRPWLLSESPRAESRAFASWRAEASVRLWSSLVDQVAGTQALRRYRLSGPPVQELEPSDDEVAGAFRPIHLAAEWVFIGTTDADARHLLFAMELAHTVRAMRLGLGETIPVALENAKVAYRAHLQSANRETLKALGELRRAVIDETQKIVQRTQDLTASLWKDLFVASAPFVIKIFPDTSKFESNLLSKAFLLISSTYLLCSFLAITVINSNFFQEQEKSRAAWQLNVSRFLPSAELSAVGDEPIKSASKMYRKVHLGVGAFYALLILLLLATAAFG